MVLYLFFKFGIRGIFIGRRFGEEWIKDGDGFFFVVFKLFVSF